MWGKAGRAPPEEGAVAIWREGKVTVGPEGSGRSPSLEVEVELTMGHRNGGGVQSPGPNSRRAETGDGVGVKPPGWGTN